MVTLRATASWEFRTALSFLVISEYILRKTFVVLLLLYKVVFTVVLHAISTMVTGIVCLLVCATEVRALYGSLSCGWLRVATLAMVGSGRGWLGAVVAQQAAGCNGRCASTGLSYTTVQATIVQSAIMACIHNVMNDKETL